MPVCFQQPCIPTRVTQVVIPPAPSPGTGEAVVTWTGLQQTIDGFGGARQDDAVTGGVGSMTVMTSTFAQLAFDPVVGAGHSIMLAGMVAGSGTAAAGERWCPYSDIALAGSYGVKVFGVPWSPPAPWKDNGSLTGGGHVLSSHYTDLANWFEQWRQDVLTNAGVAVYGVSPQNEPDFTAGYESCLYTDAETIAFSKILRPILDSSCKIIQGGYSDWGKAQDLVNSFEADGTALGAVDFIGVHQYSVLTSSFPINSAANWPVWMTEWGAFIGPYDGTIAPAVDLATYMHDALVNGRASAWIYLQLVEPDYHPPGNDALADHDQVTFPKRWWTFANYSKFIRPGWRRVTISGGPTGVKLSAYREVATGKWCVVAVNTNASSQSFGLSLDTAVSGAITPYHTTASLDLAAQSTIAPSGHRASVTIPATSVVTFVGQAS